MKELQAAIESARSGRESFPHGRVRVTPAVHEQLAEAVCAGTDMIPATVVVTGYRGMCVEIDPDAPDPGWVVETWR